MFIFSLHCINIDIVLYRFILLLFFSFPLSLFSQYQWKLEKDKNGIQIYISEVSYSKFKAAKVVCTFEGDCEKLMGILTDVPSMSEWVFRSVACKILEKKGPYDFTYHTVTDMPWPTEDRETIIRLNFNTDSLPQYLRIEGVDVPNMAQVKKGLTRVEDYHAIWDVRQITPESVSVEYFIHIDPGGGVPSWIVNMMIEKGPYETFNDLAQKMKE